MSDKRREPTPFGGETLSVFYHACQWQKELLFGGLAIHSHLSWEQTSSGGFCFQRCMHKTLQLPFILPHFSERHDISHISRLYCALDMCFSAKYGNLLLKVGKGSLKVGGSLTIWLSRFYLFILKSASRYNPVCERPDWHFAETEIESGKDKNVVLQPTVCSLLNTSGMRLSGISMEGWTLPW